VKDTSGAFPPLQLAATGALFIATNVKGIRENKENWDEFSRYVAEMVGETALRWEVLSHSGPEESLEPWKKNIDELGRLLTEVSDSVKKRADRSSVRNALSYMRDPGKIDGMKKKLDAVLVKFQLQTNIAIGHTLAEVVKNDTTILSKLDSIEIQLLDIGVWWALPVYIVFSDDKNV